MAISRSVSPQERIIMEASRKFYMERLNEQLNSLIAYKKRAETCKESNDTSVSPIPRYDRYMLPTPKVPKLQKEEQIDQKLARREKSPETRRRRSHTTEAGLYQKRERVQGKDRRHLLESLRKVQGWIENNNASPRRETDEPTGNKITDKLAAITLRDERDAKLESEMKDMHDRIATVPPVCSPNLEVIIPRERKPAKATPGKMVSVKASVISLEISEAAGSKSNVGLALAMKKVSDVHGGHGHKTAAYKEDGNAVGSCDVALDVRNCGSLLSLDAGAEPVASWEEFGNYESGDQLMTVNRNLGVWDCDRLEKKAKFDRDVGTLNKVGDVSREDWTTNLQNCDRLKSIALKLSDYTKLKSMVVAVSSLPKDEVSVVRKSNDDSKQELISVKTSEIYPQFGRGSEVLGRNLQNKPVKWGFDSKSIKTNEQACQMKPKKMCQNVGTQNSEHDFPIQTIRSDNSVIRSLGTNTQELGAATKKPRHRPMQRNVAAEDDDKYELIEILPPQFKLTDEPESDNEAIICGYLGLKNDPRPAFNIVVDSSDEQQDSAEPDRKHRVKRRKRKTCSDKPHWDGESGASGEDSGDWADSESKKVMTILEQLDISPGRDYSLEGLGTLMAEPLKLEKYTVNESKRKSNQRDSHKPEWLRNYSSKMLITEDTGSVENEGKKEIPSNQIREEQISTRRNSKWEKKNSVRSPVNDETSLDIPTLQGIHKTKETAHFNSPKDGDIRNNSPVRVVSASATSVKNIVLAAKPAQKKSPRLSKSSHSHNRHKVVKKLAGSTKTVTSATRKDTASSELSPCNSFDKRTGRGDDRIRACEMSTITDDFDHDSDSLDNKQRRLISQANLFKRPSFTLNLLQGIRDKSKNNLSTLPSSTSSQMGLEKLERLPVRRKVSNEELAKTKNEINKLLSKTSEILQRNDTERQILRQGNSLSLYREMKADLRKDSTQFGNEKTDLEPYVSKTDAFELTDFYAGGQGYESDGCVGNCPMNSLVSLVSGQKPPGDDMVEKNFLPKRVSGNLNLLQMPDDHL